MECNSSYYRTEVPLAYKVLLVVNLCARHAFHGNYYVKVMKLLSLLEQPVHEMMDIRSNESIFITYNMHVEIYPISEINLPL